MNKAELIEALANRLGEDKRTASAALEAVLAEVQSAVIKGERVAITGFGVFEKRVRAARMARNPRTGEAVRVKKTAVPAFRPGSTFKEMVASGRVPKELKATPAKKTTAAKKATATKATKAAAKKTTAAKATKATKAAAKKATTTKATKATKAAAKKTTTTARKSAAKKATPRKSVTAKKTTAKRTPAKKATKRR
ncbi:MAG TPA: HU family DNA-binding protein [Natronosporangium sp.]|nr:HU family DNA-binding protein [Natronosporangium sp.]